MKFTEMLERFPCCTWRSEDETGRLFQIYDYSVGPSCVATFEREIEPDGEGTIRYSIFYSGRVYRGIFEDTLPEGIIPLVESIAKEAVDKNAKFLEGL